MISLISTIVGFVVGGSSLWAVALKVAGWLGWGGLSSVASVPVVGPLLSFVSQIALKLVDLLLWVLKAVLRWLGGGAEIIGTSPPAAAIVVMASLFAWKFGPGDWRFWDATAPPAQTVSEPARRSVSRTDRKPCVDPLSACFWGL